MIIEKAFVCLHSPLQKTKINPIVAGTARIESSHDISGSNSTTIFKIERRFVKSSSKEKCTDVAIIKSHLFELFTKLEA